VVQSPAFGFSLLAITAQIAFPLNAFVEDLALSRNGTVSNPESTWLTGSNIDALRMAGQFAPSCIL
jgi:hypothetical protein